MVGNIVWKKHRFQGLAAEAAEEVLAACRLRHSLRPLAVRAMRTLFRM
jgi:hypothetical protein